MERIYEQAFLWYKVCTREKRWLGIHTPLRDMIPLGPYLSDECLWHGVRDCVEWLREDDPKVEEIHG